MYQEYWKLKSHPFDNVPDPQMYFDMHRSVEDSVSEVLYAIEEGNECLAVVVGPVGVGKTMCLRMVLSCLNKDKYRIAFVTNPDLTFPQLLREVVGQLEGVPCNETRKDILLEHFNRLLFQTSDQEKKVLIFIDEGNAMRPHNLDCLRLLTNMQDDHQNLLTIILAGQPELARRLEDHRRENLFQRIGVYCKIEGIDSLPTMRDYIEHRLERAGWTGESPFTDDAYREIWAFSEGGTPRLVNRICKLTLKAAESNGLTRINGDVVRAVGDRFKRIYRRLVKSRRTNTNTPPEPHPAEHSQAEMEPKPPPSHKILTPEEQERLASEIATKQVKDMEVLDPFEAWSHARDEILKEIRNGHADVLLARAG